MLDELCEIAASYCEESFKTPPPTRDFNQGPPPPPKKIKTRGWMAPASSSSTSAPPRSAPTPRIKWDGKVIDWVLVAPPKVTKVTEEESVSTKRRRAASERAERLAKRRLMAGK